MVIDPHCAKLQHFARTHSLENIGGPDRSSEAIDHIVGFPQYFLFGTEATYHNNRTEDFILHNLSIIAVFRNDGWLEEEALLHTSNAGALATCYNVCAIAQSTLNEAFNGGTLGSRDQWTHIGAFTRWVTNTNLLDLVKERLHKFVIDVVLDVDTSSRSTVLSAVNKASNDCPIGRSFNIRIIKDDEWSLTTKLQMHTLNAFGTRTHNVLATFCSACDRNHIDFAMAGKGLGYTWTTSNNIEYTWR